MYILAIQIVVASLTSRSYGLQCDDAVKREVLICNQRYTLILQRKLF